MENLTIAATELTPSVSMDYTAKKIEIWGESYAEDTAAFYAPIFQWIDHYLADKHQRSLKLDFRMVYLNSSTSKMFMDLFENLDEAVRDGRDIVVNWRYDEDNEMSLMYGEEFKADVEGLSFHLISE